MTTYNINVKQTGEHATSLVGEHAQVISNFSPESSVQDLLKLLKTIRQEIEQIDIPSDAKDEAKLEVDRAMLQAQKAEPDKPKLVESLKNAAEIVKNSSTIALGVTQFWTFIRKAIEWAL
jgi:hypothetical protein